MVFEKSRGDREGEKPRNSSHPSNDQIGASLASASVYPSVLVPEVATDDMSISASFSWQGLIQPLFQQSLLRLLPLRRPQELRLLQMASITGTPVVSAASVTEHIPTLMAPSPTVNIGSVHVPSTSVSTTVIQAIEALPTTLVATLKSTSVSDDQVLASSPLSFFEILPTSTESEPSTPATIFKATTTATATPSSNSALSENAPLNTDHTTTLEDLPATGSYFNEFEMVQRSRHGRELKPSQKVQDMQWQTVRGRKSRGCRGRGRHGDQH
ncbi:hypothetical protein Bca4012_000433 [Brassica carinata]